MTIILLSLFSISASADFEWDELDELSKLEQNELLQAANTAAKKWQFAQANDYINQAKQKSYAPEALAKTQQPITDNQQAKNFVSKAKQSAKNWDFSQAESYLQQAKNKADNSAEFNKVASLIGEQKQRAERQRLAAAVQRRRNNSRSSGSSNSSSVYCSSSQECYNVVRRSEKETTIRCKSHVSSSEERIYYDSSNGKYYRRGFGANTYESSFKKLANYVCGVYCG